MVRSATQKGSSFLKTPIAYEILLSHTHTHTQAASHAGNMVIFTSLEENIPIFHPELLELMNLLVITFS